METPISRSCRYTVVKFGDLNRDESMNIAVLVWEHDDNMDTPVLQRMIDEDGWKRIAVAFPKSGADGEVRDDVIKRIQSIKTYREALTEMARFGAYTPFEFRSPYASLESTEYTLNYMANYFLFPFKGD